MKVTFNLQSAGPANNGGTATLFNSANILYQMGHEVQIVSEVDNEFTWFPLDGPVYIKTKGFTSDYPDARVIVATGAHTVQHVLNAPASKGSKFWWVRAHETWSMDEDALIAHYRNPYIELLVNSICLKNFIKNKVGRDVEVTRPGMDLNDFHLFEERDYNWSKETKVILGGLYNNKPRKRFDWVIEIFEACKTRGLNVKLHLYGTYDEPTNTGHALYLKNPTQSDLNDFYNDIDIWIAPTKSEGLHMPPQEAMLCKCLLIGAKEPLSGMADYLLNNVTGFTMDYWSEAVDLIESLVVLNNPSQIKEVTECGRASILLMGDRRINMERLVEVLNKGEHPNNIARRLFALRRRGFAVENSRHRA